MSSPLNIVFWMDDPSTFNPNKDTTYLLIHECLRRGHLVYYASKRSISIQGNDLSCHVRQIISFELGSKISLGNHHHLSQKVIDVIWLRCDPPVDIDYVQHMWLFDQFSTDILFMNHPSGILAHNEKLAALHFPTMIPKTIVTKRKDEIDALIETAGSIILKPLDGFGGSGIFRFNFGDTNLDPAIEELSDNGNRLIVAQQALDATGGDKRILIINGRPLGAVLRVSSVSHRNNFMAGGSPVATDITESDKHIIHEIMPFLNSNGLHFVGIDIIDNHLIEINVTCPTCMHEMNQLLGGSFQIEVIDEMERMLD